MQTLDFNPAELKAIVSANSFRHFVEYLWPAVSNDRFKGGYLVDAVCEHLQAVQAGQIQRLAVACPIRHGKSLLTSVLFPVWSWLHDPGLRILSASCGEDLASRDSLRSRHLMLSPLFLSMFRGHFSLLEDQNTKTYYVNDQGGHRRAVGTGTQTTGLDADYLLVDDLLDYKKAKSEAERRHAIDFYSTVLSKRIVRGTGKDRIVVAGHRVHEGDLFNHIWNIWGNDGTWTYLVLPAEAKPCVTNSYHNAIGWKDTREEGELLNPERFPQKVIDEEKKSLRHEYHCLFQQDPTPASGDRFKPEWFRRYSEDESHYELNGKRYSKDKVWRFGTVDTAITTGENSDWTVCQIWDVIGSDLILVDQLRKRLDGSKIIPALSSFVTGYGVQFVSVEKEFVGQFIIDQLRDKNISVKPFSAKKHGDKETRAITAEIRLEAGRVWFPGRPWVADLEREILSFPNGTHDDQVDALSQACAIMDRYAGKAEPELSQEATLQRQQESEKKRFNQLLWGGCPF